MIRRIAVRNFKCFPALELGLAALDVFAGANGTGKSTVIQAILVLYQSSSSGALARGHLQLNGELIELGTARDVLYKRSDTDEFTLELDSEESTLQAIGTVPTSEPRHTVDIVARGGRAVRGPDNDLLYLSADRLGPQKSYPIDLDEQSPNPIGKRGEFAPLLYSRNRQTRLHNRALLLESDDGKRFDDLETQFVLWMSRLFPGFRARADTLDQLDAVALGMNLQHEIGEADYFRPSNIGFGVSIAFPVILAGLLARSGHLLVIENPEAHLHPGAQSVVGEFLARVASGGVQVLVETHSDHVVNGIRIAHNSDVLTREQVRFFAFMKTNEYASHNVVQVHLSESGEFLQAPDTFFDQADKDLRIIYGVG